MLKIIGEWINKFLEKGWQREADKQQRDYGNQTEKTRKVRGR